MSGSDFAPELFSSEEKKYLSTILVQLRSFERSVAKSFRKVEGRLEIIEKNIKSNKDSLAATKGSVTKVRNFLNDLHKDVQTKFGKFENFRRNPEDKEQKNGEVFENSSVDDLSEANFSVNNEENYQEIMTMDPFLGNGVFVGSFDGNPTVSFTKWVEKFKDVLSLMTEPNEAQKLARLRFCLSGQARIFFDSINPQPITLTEAIAFLKGKYENGNGKVIARQLLSNCRHAPGESVFEFANRLSDTVRTALSGDDEETIKKRLLDEFVDRLTPELQFEVKAQRPQDYANAYEIALNYELLLASRRNAYSNVSVASLAEKVEACTIQDNYRETRTCYNCGVQGHISRFCGDNGRFNNGPQYNGRFNNCETSQQNYREYEQHYGNSDHQKARDSYRRYRNRSPDSDSSGSRGREREDWRERKRNNYDNRSPNRHRFENSNPRIGAVNPYLLALVALICLI